MIRRLIVMRHAKSDWHTGAQTDHDRPLNHRGRSDAPRVARHLAELGWTPQHILSSDAQRTRETCLGMLQVWEDGIETEFLPGLYHAGARELQEELVRVPDEVEVLLVVGHNPGWQGVVYHLTEQSIPMKTATAALLTTECDGWGEVFRKGWSLENVIYPRELG